MVVFCSVISHLPASPRAAAACAAAPICSADRPASSAALSTTTAPSLVALSTFCLKRVVRLEICELIALRRQLLRIAQARAGAHELRVVALQQLHGLRLQAQRHAPLVQGTDPREQSGVQQDGVLVGSQLRRQLRLELLHEHHWYWRR